MSAYLKGHVQNKLTVRLLAYCLLVHVPVAYLCLCIVNSFSLPPMHPSSPNVSKFVALVKIAQADAMRRLSPIVGLVEKGALPVLGNILNVLLRIWLTVAS